MPVGRTDQTSTEQGGRDLEMGCPLLPAIEATQHMAKTATLGRGQSGVWKVLPVERPEKPLESVQPIVRHLVERDNGGKRLAWPRIADEAQLHADWRDMRVEAEPVMSARGKREIGSSAVLST